MKLTAITDTTMTPGHKTVRYAYDAKGCLQTVTYANGAMTGHGYDKRGNRLRRTSHVQGQISFRYDAFSRMTGITNGAVSVEYTYDSLGRKVQRLKRDTTIYPDSTYYVYDGLDPVCVIRFNPANTECTTVTWLLRGLGVAPGIGNIVAQQRYTINFGGAMSQPVTHYYHPNHRGDTAYLTDAAGVTAASYVYDAFGRLLSNNASPLTAYRFSGKEWDADAQLYYFGFRWYDPDTGTWTTKDPLGFGGLDENVYRMVHNNPVMFLDYYGLWNTSDAMQRAEYWGQRGAFWGTLAGAVVGAAFSKGALTLQGASLGALAGGVAGAGVGFADYTLEELQKWMANRLASCQASTPQQQYATPLVIPHRHDAYRPVRQ